MKKIGEFAGEMDLRFSLFLYRMVRKKRILIVRFSSIGDIVFTTPVIRCVKQQVDCELHFVTKEVFAPVLAANPYIDRLITIKHDIPEVIEELRSFQYDWVADLHHNLRTARLKYALKRPGGAFPKLNIEKWLLTNFHWDVMPDKHVVDRSFEAVAELGVFNDGKGYDVFISDGDKVNIPEITGGMLSANEYLVFAIGAGLATKNLEEDQWESLIRKVTYPVILLGGKEDAERGERLAAQTGCINLAGKLRIPQSASVVAQAAVVVTPDTGLLHIAAALHKPVVSVWGSSVLKFGCGPYYPDGMDGMYDIFEVEGLSCRPCSKIGYRKCPKGHFKCMRHQDLDAIARAVHRRLERQGQ